MMNEEDEYSTRLEPIKIKNPKKIANRLDDWIKMRAPLEELKAEAGYCQLCETLKYDFPLVWGGVALGSLCVSRKVVPSCVWALIACVGMGYVSAYPRPRTIHQCDQQMRTRVLDLYHQDREWRSFEADKEKGSIDMPQIQTFQDELDALKLKLKVFTGLCPDENGKKELINFPDRDLNSDIHWLYTSRIINKRLQNVDENFKKIQMSDSLCDKISFLCSARQDFRDINSLLDTFMEGQTWKLLNGEEAIDSRSEKPN